MIRQAIIKLANKQNLTYDEASQVMNEMMSGETTQVQIAAFLTALAMKGETIEEITGCAAAMRATPEQAAKMAAVSDGAIVGSAIVRLCAKYGCDAVKPIADYVHSMKEAIMQ